jgi:nucleoside-diphosphate-sugar epimerase
VSKHLVIGAGPVGHTTARLLADQGHEVVVATRSGTTVPGTSAVRLDAADAAAVLAAAQGAVAIYSCINPPYHRWPIDWPPASAAVLAAAERTGAVLVTMSNLYGYGPVDHPMRETDPLAATGDKGRVRARMWEEALAAHEAGRVRVTEARAGDYVGPMVTGSSLGERVVPRVLAGKAVSVIGATDAPHAFSYVPDVARTLVVLGTDERAWGKAWHVPSMPALTQREAVHALCRAAGVAPVAVKSVPPFVLKLGGLASKDMRELPEVLYQFDRPFVMDDTAARATFGLDHTPVDEVMAATVAWYRGRPARAA